jgi:hypothetical protein
MEVFTMTTNNTSKFTKAIITTSICLAIAGTCFLLVYAATDREHFVQSGNTIDKNQALSVALEDAQLQERDLDYIKNEYDRDDNQYEIEFAVINLDDNTRYVYEYEIDGRSGEIIHQEIDRDFV